MDLCSLLVPADIWKMHVYNQIGFFIGFAIGLYWLIWHSSENRLNIKIKAIFGNSVYLHATGAVFSGLGAFAGQLVAILIAYFCQG
jgi:hypothetical protein